MARPLTKTYSKTHPYVVERYDRDNGDIAYEIIDERPESYRIVCIIAESDCEDDPMQAKRDAEMIVRALNLMNGGLP